MVGVIALWSIVPVTVKLLLPVVEPFTLAFLRLVQALLVVGLTFLWRRRRVATIHRSGWLLLGAVGVILNYTLFAWSMSFTTASAGVLVVQIQYVTVAVLAAWLLGERLGAVKVAGMLLVLAGVLVVVAVRADVSDLVAPRYATGNLLMLGSGFGWGVYAVSNKALAGRMGTLSILLPMLAGATAVTGVLALTEATPWDLLTRREWGLLAVLGIAATGGAFILVAEALKRISAGLMGTMTAVSPILQIAMAHAVLDEPLTWNLGAGAVLILGGILTMVSHERRGAAAVALDLTATPRVPAGKESS